ncbi:hypothetical protein H0H81_009492 [Sphagnurus paluster]|uniref:Secreted protein n=1 Tax=Sphagnurus paluster TaxID=117069 RepID=A0A9P7GR76_9AGAR|nr:hypothetical protein H0H81_009492 [Sphagnurus paluster]
MHVLPALALVLLTRAWASQTRDARHVGCIRVALAEHKYTEEHDSMEAGGWGCGWIWGWGCTRRDKGGGYVVLGQDDEEAQAQGPQMHQRPHQDRYRAPQRPSYLLPPPSQVEEPYALTPGPPSFAVRASAGYGRYAYADLGDVQTGTGADWRK